MNKSIKEHQLKVKLVDINLVRTGMVIAVIILTAGNTVLSINAENKEEVVEYPELISVFDEMVYGDSVIEHFYMEYNTYFGGYYIKDGNIIICITVDTPLDGISYLNDANRAYEFVNINYTQLQEVYNYVVKIAMDEGYMSVGINHRDNLVVLRVKPDTIIAPELTNYIEGGILEIIESNLSIVDTSE
jgi:hypothetical protein